MTGFALHSVRESLKDVGAAAWRGVLYFFLIKMKWSCALHDPPFSSTSQPTVPSGGIIVLRLNAA